MANAPNLSSSESDAFPRSATSTETHCIERVLNGTTRREANGVENTIRRRRSAEAIAIDETHRVSTL